VPDGLDGARRYIDHALEQHAAGRRLPFTILLRDRVVGCTSLYEMETWDWPPGSPMQRHDRPDVVKIGYTWLAHSAQRTGCNTEAKLLLLGHAFEAWEVHCVAFCSDARNLRSRAAIERLGARFDGVLRAHKPATDGGVRDSAFHSIIRSEWPAWRADPAAHRSCGRAAACADAVPGVKCRRSSGAGRRVTLLDEGVDALVGWTDLERSEAHAWVLRHQCDRVVQVARFQDEDPAQVFLGFRIRPVGDLDALSATAERHAGLRLLQRLAPDEVAAAAEFVVVGKALLHCRCHLGFAHRAEG
jgi:RimJ/RimL family protein N-acetyltransferase